MGNAEQKISKPLILEIEEAEREATEALNDIMARHNLPFSFFEPIIDKIHFQMTEGKKKEIANASAQYEAEVERAKAAAEEVGAKEE